MNIDIDREIANHPTHVYMHFLPAPAPQLRPSILLLARGAKGSKRMQRLKAVLSSFEERPVRCVDGGASVWAGVFF